MIDLRVGDRVKVVGVFKNDPYAPDWRIEFERELVGETGIIEFICDPRDAKNEDRCVVVEFDNYGIQEENEDVGKIVFRPKELRRI